MRRSPWQPRSSCSRVLRPGCGIPRPSGGAADCRTLRHKTHGIEAGDEVLVVYAWHPWARQLVRVHETIERPTGAQARCSPTNAGGARLREIPVWMLDAAVCCSMWTASEPVAAPSALAALRSLLLEAMGGAVAVASPAHHCGDRHATPSSPATDAGAPARPVPAEPLGSIGRGSRMGGLAGPDTANADRAAGPPVHGARCRRSTGSRE